MTFKWECSIKSSLALSLWLFSLLHPALIHWKKLIQLKFTSSKWLSGNTPSAVIKNSKRAFFSTVRDLIHCVPGCFIGSLYKSLLPFQLTMSEMWIKIQPKVTRHLMHLWIGFYYSQYLDQTGVTSQHRYDHCWIHRCFFTIIHFYGISKTCWASNARCSRLNLKVAPSW